MSQKPWEEPVRDHLLQKYRGESIEKPRDITFKLKGKSITLEKTWYDVLVLPPHLDSRVLDGNKDTFHCVEVKWSDKGNLGSFGAFTLGEWIRVGLSLSPRATFTYEIMYVYRKDGKIKIKKLRITRELLEDMFNSPQLKLYFQESFIRKHSGKPAKVPTHQTTQKQENKDKFIKQYLLKVKDNIKKDMFHTK